MLRRNTILSSTLSDSSWLLLTLSKFLGSNQAKSFISSTFFKSVDSGSEVPKLLSIEVSVSSMVCGDRGKLFHNLQFLDPRMVVHHYELLPLVPSHSCDKEELML